MAGNILVTFVYGAVQFALSAALGVAGIYFGAKAFDKLTVGIEEFKELEKGNVAVGILMAAVMACIAISLRAGVFEFAHGIQPEYSLPLLLVLGFVNLVKIAFGLIIAVLTIFVSLNLLDWLTRNINETEELKKGNVAIAILIAGVLLSVALVVEAGMRETITSPDIESCAIARQVGSAIGIDASVCVPYVQAAPAA